MTRDRGADDLLNLVAHRHRSLQHVLRELAEQGASAADLERFARELLREESLKRALLHPLLARISDGDQAVERRREEQELLIHQTARVCALASESEPENGRLEVALQELYQTLIGHTDREELEDSPRLRHEAEASELETLAVIHEELTIVIEPAVSEAVSRMPSIDPMELLETEIGRHLDPPAVEVP